MIYKCYVIECDWCGRQEFFSLNPKKKEALKSYADRFLLYKYKSINPTADYLFVKSKKFVPKYLMFCCDECIKEYFNENPNDVSHYNLV